jgi:ribosomal protein S12 methylthiotransferase accessory factor
VPEVSTRKRYVVGTHRLCDPLETFERIRPLMPMLGITRVADVTRLDRIGIPMYQAIRPNSRALAVSQGKGLTAIAAKVSAVMECAEWWHAERVPAPSRVARVADIEADLGYDIFDLRQVERGLLNRGTRLEWLEAERMDGSGQTFVPRACASIDGRVARRWAPPVFFGNSNGLASGNSMDEAALHALLEVVERDGTARLHALPSQEERAVDAASVDAPEARHLLDQLDRAGIRVQISDARGPTELACFEVRIRSEDHTVGFIGAGCHLDPSVALCRALTEAAQSRLGQIAGGRDDLTGTFRHVAAARRGNGLVSLGAFPVRFDQIVSMATDNIDDDLDLVVERVKAQSGVSPIVADLSHDEVGIAVVKVTAPALAWDYRPSEMVRAKRRQA